MGRRLLCAIPACMTFWSASLISAFPYVRDFKGLSPNSFDGRGNYSCGVKEQIIFPEVNYEKIEKVRGLSVTICTTATKDEESKALLTAFGMPFRK